MAAIGLSTVNSYPHQHRLTLSATPSTMQAYTIPAAATQVQIIWETNAGQLITQGGTDGAVISTEHWMKIPADSLYYHDLPRSKGQHTIWIASLTGSTACTIQIGARD